MAVTLSPWPTTPAATAAAIACLKAAVDPNLDDARVDALGAASAALVERYAPMAPDAVRNEACIRTAGYLHQQPAAAVRSEAVGDITTAYATSMPSALRHSGAMALLSSWKTRRAGMAG